MTQPSGTWNPEQYHLFKEARSAPARDLQAMLPERPYRAVVDLGCGTGEQTLQLAQRFTGAQVLGLDSSAEMLSKAAELSKQAANLRFEQRDIQALEGQYDLIYSNAALQWLPDHPALLAKLWAHLNPGGVLAVQVPANHDHASHRLFSETAQEFTAELGGYTRFGPVYGVSPVLTPAAYAETLDAVGAQSVSAISKVYPVVLEGAQGIIEWTRGTALLPYLARLDAAQQERFVGRYLEKLKQVYPSERVYYAFTRVLFVAHKLRYFA